MIVHPPAVCQSILKSPSTRVEIASSSRLASYRVICRSPNRPRSGASSVEPRVGCFERVPEVARGGVRAQGNSTNSIVPNGCTGNDERTLPYAGIVIDDAYGRRVGSTGRVNVATRHGTRLGVDQTGFRRRAIAPIDRGGMRIE